MGARRGKRIRTAAEAYEAAYTIEDAENRELGRELKERYIYG
jgi:hypothetical protein